MAFMLGTFMDGMFGGAGAVADLYAKTQENEQRQYGLDAARALTTARGEPEPQPAQATPINVQDPTTVGTPTAERTTAADLTTVEPRRSATRPAPPPAEAAAISPTGALGTHAPPEGAGPQQPAPVQDQPPAPAPPRRGTIGSRSRGFAPLPTDEELDEQQLGPLHARPAPVRPPPTVPAVPPPGALPTTPAAPPAVAAPAAPAATPAVPGAPALPPAPTGLETPAAPAAPPSVPGVPAAPPPRPGGPAGPIALPSFGARLSSLVGIGSAQAATLDQAPAGALDQAGGAAAPPATTVGQTAPRAAAPAGQTAPQAAPAAPGARGTPGPAGTAGTAAAPVPAPAGGAAPAPAAAGSSVVFPTGDNTVAPSQQGGTTQGQPTPTLSRPAFDARPYALLARDARDHRELVDRIAQEEGITPQRLALHWHLESGMRTQAPNGTAGERGPLQMLPSTQRGVDPQMRLNPDRLEDSLRMGARYIRQMDNRFGQDSASSVVAYQQGPGGAEAIARGQGQHFTNGQQYLERAYNGQRVGPEAFNGPIDIDATTMIRTGTSQGPDGLLTYIAQTGGPQMPLSDKWRAAETALMAAAAAKGDIAGMRHAQDFILQMSQQGHTTSLMNAYRALQSGDGTTAAQQLARASAFFPDGSMGRFGIDQSGNVWGQRVDEHDPSKPLGARFQVTADGLQNMLIQSRDPAKYMEQVRAQQKHNSDMRFRASQGDYYADLVGSRERIAQEGRLSREHISRENRLTREHTARMAADARVDAAEIGADGRAGGAGDAAATRIEAETQRLYGPSAKNADGEALDSTTASRMSQIHYGLRSSAAAGFQSMGALQARELTTGLHDGSLQVVPTQRDDPAGGGKLWAVTGPGGVRAMLSSAAGRRIYDIVMPAGRTAPGASPPTVVSPNSAAIPQRALN